MKRAPILAVADGVGAARSVRTGLENALAHSPPASTIPLFARTRVDRVELGVAGQGSGLAPGRQARVGEN